jgi:polar amino acid transport system substrate-binding protein
MKCKKTFMGVVVAIALVSFCICGLVACSSSSTTNSNSASSGKSPTTTLTVGFDQDFPPYGYVGNDGQYTGFDLELAKEVCARNGWNFIAQPIDWDAKDMELQSGTINCIWNGFTINGRESAYTWTDPYMDNSQVIVVKKSSGITSLSGLAGKTVITQAASAALTVLQDPEGQETLASTFKKLLTTIDYNTAFMELKSGAVDAVAIDLPVAQYQTANSNDFVILNEHLSEEQYGVGFLKGNTGLRDQVETTLKAMVADGFVEKLCGKYADQGISYENWVLK